MDDHVVARNGIRLMLGTDDGIEVVAEAETARAALYLLQAQAFDVAIVDIGLPDQNGLQLLK
ncbi:MAG: response regulator, partial [Janthinobacterium sp.]